MRWTLAIALMVLSGGSVSMGQVVVPPFFTGGVGAFDPQVSVVNAGALLDAQAVVSHDRKYVTLTMRPTNSALIAMQTFGINTGTLVPSTGFPGGVNPAGNAPNANANNAPNANGAIAPNGRGPAPNTPMGRRLARQAQGAVQVPQADATALLNRRGMIKLGS